MRSPSANFPVAASIPAHGPLQSSIFRDSLALNPDRGAHSHINAISLSQHHAQPASCLGWIPRDPIPPLASATYHIGNLEREVGITDVTKLQGCVMLTATLLSTAAPRPPCPKPTRPCKRHAAVILPLETGTQKQSH